MHPANPTPTPAVQAFLDWNARARALELPTPTADEAEAHRQSCEQEAQDAYEPQDAAEAHYYGTN